MRLKAKHRLAARLTAELPGATALPFLVDLATCEARLNTIKRFCDARRLHRRTLSSRCNRAGLPGPSDWLAAFRLVRIHAALTESGRSTADVVWLFHFSSVSALYRHVKRATGYRVGDWREIHTDAVIAWVIETMIAPHRGTLQRFRPVRTPVVDGPVVGRMRPGDSRPTKSAA